MKHRIRSIVIAIYLLLCMVLGGSAQGVWGNLALQLGGIGLLAWVAIARAHGGVRFEKALNIILVCALALILVQLIPLPAKMWTSLPGREEIAQGLTALRYPIGSLPISEMPYASVLTLFAILPAIGLFFAVQQFAPSPRAIALAIVLGLAAGVFLSAVQIAGGAKSWAYFYEIHNPGAIGLFANKNHMATLFLVGIPMAAAFFVSLKSRRQSLAVGNSLIAAALLALVVIGIALNGSRAAIGLSIPVIIASISFFPAANRWRGVCLAASAFALIAGILVIVASPLVSSELDIGAQSAELSRGGIWKTTEQAVVDNFPVGTGLGSFEHVYHGYEDPAQVTPSYVNHAHNDYLELALELGLGGIILIGAFLIWWLLKASQIWASPVSSPFTRAATIASAAILAHSAVDFPLRTGAISAIFAACIALMAQYGRGRVLETGEVQTGRHVRL